MRQQLHGLSIASELHAFIEDEALSEGAISPETFWSGLAATLKDFAPRNLELLRRRDVLQASLDDWHRAHGRTTPAADYEAFLRKIDYLHPDPPPFHIETEGVDPEVAAVAAPQLVVPLTNARYVLNAANARWGSLYDALYATDALGLAPPPPAAPYDRERGGRVIAFGRHFLDQTAPLREGSYADVQGFTLDAEGLAVQLATGRSTRLRRSEDLAGYRGPRDTPSAVLLVHHGLHVEIQLDRADPIGRDDPAGVCDIVIESAITTIMDGEDSVATVDAADKVRLYRNWLGLMRGDLAASFDKDGHTVTRSLAADRPYSTLGGGDLTLRGRSVLFARNVGLHLLTDAVLDSQGDPVPENIVDAFIIAAIGAHDLASRQNSRTGAIYIVRPKMHGPDEVAFADQLFGSVERHLHLPAFTLKMGLMDEERRTSANLASCLSAAKQRIVFINTGFLDRTGDEIRSVMEAGAVGAKDALRHAQWLQAYEARNVHVGLACGLGGRGQIGKGMWAAPDRMADMLAQKIAQPLAGASTAWAPSPTAATLHALHYHMVDVSAAWDRLRGVEPPSLSALLTPALNSDALSPADIQRELDNNCQGILGYVVRWIDQGIGCSKVPDIHDVGLMEDRATLRISSQHIANWMRHGLVTSEQVTETLRRMARTVDRQNAGDPAYEPMAPSYDGHAFAAAHDLIFKALEQPNGYTEFLLSAHRRRRKANAAKVAA